jgi:hypothetical protein
MSKWRKIAALGTGALMLGATLTGALAAKDLGSWTTDFISNGVLDNTVIAVGKTAQTSDVLGAIDIAAALQAAAVSPIALDGSAAIAPTITSGVKVEKSGNKFNYADDIDTVLESTALDDSDLPDMLGDGKIDESEGAKSNKEDFSQTLTFSSGTAVFNLYQDDDLAEMGGDYLFLDSTQLYSYTFEFDSAVNFDTSAVSADWSGAKVEIQGNVYTITDASVDGNGLLDELTLVSGDSTVWLVQDQPYTIGGHTVTVVDVSNSEDKCGVNVDGVTVWVTSGSTEDFGDLSIGVLDVVAVYTEKYDADTCEISVGSNELLLKEGDQVEVNGEVLDGSEVTFDSAEGTWTGFTITYSVGDEDSGVNSDQIYLAEGDSWSDPVFGNFKVQFAGTSAKTEMIELARKGSDKAEFTFKNSESDNIKVPYIYQGTGNDMMLGDDEVTGVLLLPGQNRTDVAPGGAADPEGTLLLYTTTGGEVRVLEVDKVYGTTGANANKVTIKDWNTGDTLADKKTFLPGVENSTIISLGSLGSVNLTLVSGSSGTVVFNWDASYGAGWPETMYEAKLNFTNGNVTLLEANADEKALSTLQFGITYDSGNDDRVELQTPSEIGAGSILAQVDKTSDNSDDQIGVTPRGTMIEWDTDNQDKVTVVYPDEEVYANVFVAPHSASVVGGASGVSSAEKVNPFSVGLAVLDEDAESMNKNMIVVGGPCVNTVAAGLMGNPASCAEGFEAGKAMLKYFDRSGKVALLVAGYDAEDTLGAAYVLADSGSYSGLSGDEVEVVVTSLDQIKINKV